MEMPTTAMTSPEMLEEAKVNVFRLVELLTALENRFDGAWEKHILVSLTLKAKEIEYFLPEMS